MLSPSKRHAVLRYIWRGVLRPSEGKLAGLYVQACFVTAVDGIVNFTGNLAIANVESADAFFQQLVIKGAVRLHAGGEEDVVCGNGLLAPGFFKDDALAVDFGDATAGKDVDVFFLDHIAIDDMIAVTATVHNLWQHLEDGDMVPGVQAELNGCFDADQPAADDHDFAMWPDAVLFEGVYRQRDVREICARDRQAGRCCAGGDDDGIKAGKIL